jgi:hypothetical protein
MVKDRPMKGRSALGKARSARAALPLLVVLAAPLGVACESKPKSSPPVGDAGVTVDKFVTADPKLEKALKAAASAAPDDKGPPLNGVFAAGVADKRHPKALPTTVEMVSDGTEPRVLIAGPGDAARGGSNGPAQLEIAAQMGARSALPTVDFKLVLGPAKKDDGGADWLVGDVTKSVPAREQFGELPEGTDKEIAKIVGTQLRVKTGADGLGSDVGVVLSKTAPPELSQLAQNGVAALQLSTVAPPPKAVGVGAQWIAETRMELSGIEVIAYRAYRVKSVTGDRLRISMDLKGYATTSDQQLAGVPKGANLIQLSADGQGEMEVVKGELVARKADIQQRSVMVFQVPSAKAGAPSDPFGQGGADQDDKKPPAGAAMTAQIVSQATLVRGEDLRAALKAN